MFIYVIIFPRQEFADCEVYTCNTGSKSLFVDMLPKRLANISISTKTSEVIHTLYFKRDF